MFCYVCNTVIDNTKCCPTCGTMAPGAEMFINELSYYRWTSDLLSRRIKHENKTDYCTPTNQSLNESRLIANPLYENLVLLFGTDLQGNKIEWNILYVESSKALLICTDVVRTMSYQVLGSVVSWENCLVRQWLNNQFLFGCFTSEERKLILPCKLDDEVCLNTISATPDQVQDKIFILSSREAKLLFANDEKRATGSWWWLRSLGDNPRKVACVSGGGFVYDYGHNVDSCYGVRPALWLNLDA